MAQHHILIVDDEPAIRTILRRLLESEGYTVSEASDGRTALDVVRHCRISLLVIDLMMPEVNGVDVVRQVRTDPRFRTLPALFITSHAGLQAGQWTEPRHVTALLTKPLNLTQVVALVQQLVNQT
jgi:CheY-like chemotaxis protein